MRLQIVLAALTGALETDMKRAQSIVEKRSRAMEKQAYETGRRIGSGLRDSIVGAVSGIALGAAFKNAIAQADVLGEIAERAGIGAEELSRMGYAAKLSGIEIQGFANANRQLAQRLEKNEELFATLGVATQDASGRYRGTIDIIRDLGDAFAAMPDGVEKANIASDIFGSKLGTQMIPLLNRGTEGIKELERAADSLGVTLSAETAEQAGQFNDQMDRMGAIFNNLLLNALPAINAGMSAASKAFVIFRGAVEKAAILAAAFVQVLDDLADRVVKQFGRIRDLAGVYSDIFTMGVGPAYEKWSQTLSEALAEPAKQGLSSILEFQNALIEMGGIDQRTAAAISALDAAGTSQRGNVIPDLEEEAEGGATGGRSGSERRARESKEEAAADRALADAKAAIAESIRATDEARKAAKAAREEELAFGASMVEDLKFELELMKMTNAEQATAIQLRGMSAEAIQEYGAKLQALNEEREREIKLTEQMDGLRQATSNLFEDLISGTVSAKDAFRSFVDDVLANITRMVSQNFTESLFGGFGQNGGGLFGGLAQSLFSGLFGGKAGGGPVSGGTPYLVGENGPELFVPPSNGRIANNAELRGMGRGGTTINISVEGQVDMRSRQQLAADVGRTSQRALARTG
jgi:hypothetical protein